MTEEYIPIDFDIPEDKTQRLIKVIGVGGGGCNAVKNMYNEVLAASPLLSVTLIVSRLYTLTFLSRFCWVQDWGQEEYLKRVSRRLNRILKI